MIQSKIPLLHDYIDSKKSIIKRDFISLKVDFKNKKVICEFNDYAVLENNALLNIRVKEFSLGSYNVQQLFEMLQDPILTSENLIDELEKLVNLAGLYRVKNSPNPDGTTDYLGQPENWELCE